MRYGFSALHALLAVLLLASGACLAAPGSDCDAPLPDPLALVTAEQRLERRNRDVVAARLAYEAASADVRVASERPNPSLTLGASNVNPQAGIGSGPLRDKTIDSSLRLEQLVERGDKLRLRGEAAQALLAAAGADVAEQIRLQRLAMRVAYFDLAAAQERARLQREFRVLAEGSAEASRRRFEAGDVARVEADRFRLDAVRAANDERQAAIDLQRARVTLATLLGAESRAASIDVVSSWTAPEPALSASRVGERPDVAAARQRVLAAERSRDVARALATRDVTIGVQADRWPTSPSNLQGTGTSYSLSVSVPLHVFHANEGELARAMADLETARASLERAGAVATAESRIAEDEWNAARERLQSAESEVVPAARDLAAGAEFAYSRGATGVLDLLDARRSLKSVELDEVQLSADAAKAWARREAALEALAPERP